MLRASVSDFRDNISEIINRVYYGGEHAIIHRRGRDFVAIIPVTELKVLEHIENIMDIQEIDKGLSELKAGKTTNFYDFIKKLGIGDEVIRN